VQPSELAKPAFLVISAWLMARRKELSGFPGNILAMVLFGLMAGLLILQPDLGMAVVFSVSWGAQVFLAGFPLRLIALLIALGVIGLLTAYFTLSHVYDRVNDFLFPGSGDTHQIDASIEAFQSGGLAGVGLGQGHIKSYLPDSHADFIFAVAAEELGFVFILIIMFLYAYILWRGFNLIIDNSDAFVVLSVGGILSMFGIQAFIHMGSSLNLLPTKGMTLPFISYGGSSLLSTGLSAGIILGLTRRDLKRAASSFFRH